MNITADQIKELIPTETALCATFIAEFNAQPGWVCYPETGGFDILTAKEIVEEGCSASTWTQRWLVRHSVRGHWVESDQMPTFDVQHPDMYAIALASAKAKRGAAADLITTAEDSDGQE